jgi:hypothetical protein
MKRYKIVYETQLLKSVLIDAKNRIEAGQKLKEVYGDQIIIKSTLETEDANALSQR